MSLHWVTVGRWAGWEAATCREDRGGWRSSGEGGNGRAMTEFKFREKRMKTRQRVSKSDQEVRRNMKQVEMK